MSAAHRGVLALGAGQGYDADVRAEVDRMNEVGLRSLEPSFFWTSVMAKASLALVRVGTEPEKAELYELIHPSAGLNALCVGAVSYWGSLSHHLGVLASHLGLWDAAEDHLTEAALTHERLGARVWLARTQLETAALLAARNRHGEAGRRESLLGAALATAKQLDLPVIAERALTLVG
jgi:hypothetical protein